MSFSVAASACAPVEFQWYFEGTALAGQTNDTLLLTNVTLTSSGAYYAVATSASGSSTSGVALLTVDLAAPTLVLTSSENPAGFKDNVYFTASLMPTNATGSVRVFKNGALDIAALVSGTATSAAATRLPRGTNLITAIYFGNKDFTRATNTLEQIVTNHPPAAAPFFAVRDAGAPVLVSVEDLATNWNDADDDIVFLVEVSVSTNGVAITNDGSGTLIYYNSNGVDDAFVCTLSDGWGGTNYQVIYISMAPPPPDVIPAIRSISRALDNDILLELTGAQGFT